MKQSWVLVSSVGARQYFAGRDKNKPTFTKYHKKAKKFDSEQHANAQLSTGMKFAGYIAKALGASS